MNKKTMKIAGWALGLSLAVAGIGAAVATSAHVKPIATSASSGTYTKISATSDLSTGDKVILATEKNSAPDKGVTGGNTSGNNRDALFGTTESEWAEYTVTTTGSGWTLYDASAEKYIGIGSNYFQYNASGATLYSDSNGYLLTATSSGRFLGINGSNARFYAQSNLGTYTPFRVWKISAAKTIESVNVTTQPTKTEYKIGESFDPTGMVVTITYDDDSTLPVSYSSSDAAKYQFTGFNSSSAEEGQQVTVKYAPDGEVFYTCSTKISLDIIEVNPDGITIDVSDVKTSYDVGETLDLTGLSIEIHYDNNDTETVEIANNAEFIAKGFSLKLSGSTFDLSTTLTKNDHDGKSFVVWYGSFHDDVNTIDVDVVVVPTYTLVKADSQLVYGATYAIAEPSKGVAAGAFNDDKGYLGKVDVTFVGETFKEVAGIKTFTLGAASGGYALFDGTHYLSSTAAKTMKLENTHASDGGNAITINADATNGYSLTFGDVGTVLYNVSSPRFLNYTSSPNASMITARLYQLVDETVSFGAKTWATAFNAELDPICETKGAIKNSWDGLSAKTSFSSLDGFSKDVLAYGIAKSTALGGDEIGEALASYDFCVSYYNLTKFIVDSSDVPVSRALTSNVSNGFANGFSSESSMPLVCTVAALGAAATAGFFLIQRKRKEN